MRRRGRCAGDVEHQVVDVAVPPVLARLVRADDRMLVVRVEMRRRVPVRRLVAAADMTTSHAETEVHPTAPHPEAVLATPARRLDRVVEVNVLARRAHCRGHAKLLSARWSSGTVPKRPARKSSMASRISSRVFITNGP